MKENSLRGLHLPHLPESPMIDEKIDCAYAECRIEEIAIAAKLLRSYFKISKGSAKEKKLIKFIKSLPADIDPIAKAAVAMKLWSGTSKR